MVITDLKYATDQIILSKKIKEALDFLHNTDLQELPIGRTEIDGDTIFALVQSYESRMEHDEPKFELHRKYVDVQYLISGAEIMAWALHHPFTETVPYNQETDVVLGTIPASEWSPVLFPAGRVIVFYPTDAHASGLAVDQPEEVKKVIIKVALGS